MLRKKVAPRRDATNIVAEISEAGLVAEISEAGRGGGDDD